MIILTEGVALSQPVHPNGHTSSKTKNRDAYRIETVEDISSVLGKMLLGFKNAYQSYQTSLKQRNNSSGLSC